MVRVQSRLWYGVEADTGCYAASMLNVEAVSEFGEIIERTRG